MTHGIRLHALGGPEVLRWEAIEVASPGANEVRLRHTAAGVNYMDVYYRLGLYPAKLPIVLGNEAAGVVEELGAGVTDFKLGDRVAYVTPATGAYSEARVLAADQLVKLPDAISDVQGATMMMRGMTVQYLLRRTYRVAPGDTLLVHAAAGGIGLVMCQWARHLGATVIGTVSTEDKARLALAHGCTHVINYAREDFVQRVSELTEGRKVAVVYDGVGKDTFARSLDCLRPMGTLVLFGHASGKVPPFDLLTLAGKGSLYVTRPTLWTYIATRADLVATANELIEVMTGGAVRIPVNQSYPLREAAQAHRDLEARRTTGATVLAV